MSNIFHFKLVFVENHAPSYCGHLVSGSSASLVWLASCSRLAPWCWDYYFIYFCFADIIFIQSSKTRHIEELHESIVEVQEEEEMY